MEITQRRIEPDVTVMTAGGRLTLGRETQSFEAAVAELLAKGERKLVLDLTDLAYVDSAGLGVLLAAASQIKQSGGDLRVAAVGAKVMQVLKMTRTDSVLSIHPDVATAATKF
jgi:anti-sigma B factor antagonist